MDDLTHIMTRSSYGCLVCVYEALLMVIGQMLYTLGWSSRRVRDVCGDDAGPFVLDQCHIGLFSLLLLLLLLLLLISVFLHPSVITAHAQSSSFCRRYSQRNNTVKRVGKWRTGRLFSLSRCLSFMCCVMH